MSALEFPQRFPSRAGSVERPTQADIRREPLLRRASIDYARKHGGDLIRAIIRKAEAAGLAGEQTRVMVQRSYTVEYPSPFHWHLDYMPGTPGDMADQLVHPTSGVIVNLHSDAFLGTTDFLVGGAVRLDAGRAKAATYRGVSHFREENEGELYWYNAVIEEQIANGELQVAVLDPNELYAYDSTNFHRPPRLGDIDDERSRIQLRIIARLNTPHPAAPHDPPPPNDGILTADYVYFTSKPGDPGKWIKRRTLEHPRFRMDGESARVRMASLA